MTMISRLSFRWMALFALVAAAFAAAPTLAQDGPDEAGARAFIDKLSEDAVAVWQNPTLSEKERQKAYRDLLYKGFDVNFLAKLVLGRHVRSGSPEQLEQYMELFPPYIINTFAKRIGDYSNERLEMLGTAPAGSRDVFVRTNIVRPKGEPIATDWRVRKYQDDAFKIVDIKVEGISMAITQRDEFSSIISKSGMDGLLAELRRGAVIEPLRSEAG